MYRYVYPAKKLNQMISLAGTNDNLGFLTSVLVQEASVSRENIFIDVINKVAPVFLGYKQFSIYQLFDVVRNGRLGEI